MKKYSHRSKRFLHKSLGLGSASLCLLVGLANNAKAATDYYFDANGATTGFGIVNGTTYSWDSTDWSTSSAGTSATAGWTAGGFAEFTGGSSADANIVTVNASESMAGMYMTTAGTLAINDAGNGTGSLSIVPNPTKQEGFGYTEGFLTAGTLTINVPIIGTGGVEEETGGGHLQLFGANTYSGGTLFTSSTTFVDYNSSSSFGTGPIGYENTTFSLMESQGSTPITLANNVQILIGTTGVDFIGTAPTIFTGTWAGSTFALNLRNNSASTVPVTFKGVISGSGTVTYSGASGATINLSAANTYTGATVIGTSGGDTSVIVKGGVANAIAHTSSVTLAGGTFDPGGYNQTMSSTPLAMSASSVIDYEAGTSSVVFANSASQTWTGTLTINNWTSSDVLQIGTVSGDVTAAQLLDIDFTGYSGPAIEESNGDIVPAPEPSTALLGVVGGLGVLWGVRRRKA
jgi:hypothetical protein